MTHRLSVTVSDPIYRAVGREAAIAGCSMGEFIRTAALTHAVESRTRRAVDAAPLPAITKVLAAIDDHAAERGWDDVRVAVRDVRQALADAALEAR